MVFSLNLYKDMVVIFRVHKWLPTTVNRLVGKCTTQYENELIQGRPVLHIRSLNRILFVLLFSSPGQQRNTYLQD